MNRRLASALLSVVLLAVACAPAASTPAPAASTAPAAPASAPASNPVPAAPTASAALKPELPTSPVVDLKIGVLQLSNYAPFFIGQARGYFKQLGLNVELIPTGNIVEQLSSIAQGQIQVGACAANVACYNALNRRIEVQIVADSLSAGKTEKAAGGNALVVRKDLWDDGTIRTPKDLVGRTIYLIPGPGSGHHAATARWLQRNGVDPLGVEWGSLASFADQLAALENRGIELGVQTEPLLAAGIARGTHQVMATIEDMDPAYQALYLVYWNGIEQMGPMVGERVMVAYLRGVRDFINAFEYGIDQDEVVDILTKETFIKDPAVYRQIKYGWINPDGAPLRQTIEGYAELFRELGLINTPIDLSQAFNDKYTRFAVQYLGEYRPPR